MRLTTASGRWPVGAVGRASRRRGPRGATLTSVKTPSRAPLPATDDRLRWRWYAVVAGLAVLLFTSLSAGAAAPVLGPIRTIAGLTTPAFLPDVALQGSTAVAVFEQAASGDVDSKPYRRYSTDGGQTWSTTGLLFDGAGRNADVAIVGDRVHVVFEARSTVDPTQTLVAYTVSKDGGKTFSPAVQAGTSGDWETRRFGPGPRVGGYGTRFWIAQVDDKRDFFLLRGDADKFILPPTEIEVDPLVRTGPFALASDGLNIYALAQVDNFGASILLYKSTDGGKTFAPSRELAPVRTFPYGGLSLAAYGRRVAVSWQPPRSTTLQVRVSGDRGATFGKPFLFKGGGRGGVALGASLKRIELLRTQEVPAGQQGGSREQLLLSVLPKGGVKFDRPVVVRLARRIGFPVTGPPVIAADTTRSLYAWFELNGRTSRVLVRDGQYPE